MRQKNIIRNKFLFLIMLRMLWQKLEKKQVLETKNKTTGVFAFLFKNKTRIAPWLALATPWAEKKAVRKKKSITEVIYKYLRYSSIYTYGIYTHIRLANARTSASRKKRRRSPYIYDSNELIIFLYMLQKIPRKNEIFWKL